MTLILARSPKENFPWESMHFKETPVTKTLPSITRLKIQVLRSNILNSSAEHHAYPKSSSAEKTHLRVILLLVTVTCLLSYRQ